MDLNDAVLTCAVNMQWTNSVGITGRKLAYKTATLRLVRNDLRELFVEVTPEKLKPLKFKLKDLMVHKKFMAEGKATFNQPRSRLLDAKSLPAAIQGSSIFVLSWDNRVICVLTYIS